MDPTTAAESALAHLAALSPEKVQKVQQLEARLGDAYLIAYEGCDVYEQPLPPAQLNTEQVDELTRTERELGVCLIAYKKAA